MAVVVLNKDNFESEALKSKKKVLIDFWAPWCGPCRIQGPIVEEFSKEHKKYKVCSLNVDENNELAEAFEISGIPTIVVIEKGEIIEKAVGVQGKEALIEMMEAKKAQKDSAKRKINRLGGEKEKNEANPAPEISRNSKM
ncbi:MAG: thioredoxin [Eubacterium sp.]|jgi:thioredoxin 1|nr:thioredoxin [Eubacterium sp.]